MLEDHKRTGAYYQAVMQNRRQFKDKVVLDVGAGSGILAIFAALAGASRVYAVEATAMAKMAETLIEHNQVGRAPEWGLHAGMQAAACCWWPGCCRWPFNAHHEGPASACGALVERQAGCLPSSACLHHSRARPQQQGLPASLHLLSRAAPRGRAPTDQHQAPAQLGHIITVVQGTMETVDLPEKVDIIISEWMGYFLLRESMLDTVLHARDRFLKPGGALYPSHARLYMAPAVTQHTLQRAQELQARPQHSLRVPPCCASAGVGKGPRTVLVSDSQAGTLAPARSKGTLHPSPEACHLTGPVRAQGAMQGWHGFTDDMQSCYGVDMRCLDATFEQEQQQYYLQTSAWADVHPSQLQGPPACLRTYDLATLTQQELEAPLQARSCLHAPPASCCLLARTAGARASARSHQSLVSYSTAVCPRAGSPRAVRQRCTKARLRLDAAQATFTMDIMDSGHVNAFCGFFDVSFKGSRENPADMEVQLSTAPDPRGSTHWGQQLFALQPPIHCHRGARRCLSPSCAACLHAPLVQRHRQLCIHFRALRRSPQRLACRAAAALRACPAGRLRLSPEGAGASRGPNTRGRDSGQAEGQPQTAGRAHEAPHHQPHRPGLPASSRAVPLPDRVSVGVLQRVGCLSHVLCSLVRALSRVDGDALRARCTGLDCAPAALAAFAGQVHGTVQGCREARACIDGIGACEQPGTAGGRARSAQEPYPSKAVIEHTHAASPPPLPPTSLRCCIIAA